MLTDFVALWVQTPSDYDVLVARTMRGDWARKHRPVVTRNNVHTLYTGYHVTEPNGEVVVCHRGCGIESRTWEVKAKEVVITCQMCQSQCTIDKLASNMGTLLGSRLLVKTPYPQRQARTIWSFLGVPGQRKTVPSKKRKVLAGVEAPAHSDQTMASMRPTITQVHGRTTTAQEQSTSPTTLPLHQASHMEPEPAPELYHRGRAGISATLQRRLSETPSLSHPVITPPPPSLSPSPSPASSHSVRPLTIVIPARPSTPGVPRLPRSTSQTLRAPEQALQALPISRSQSTPKLGDQISQNVGH